MRKILVVSGNSAERGLLESVMIELKAIKGIEAKWFFFESTDPIPDLIAGFDAYLKYFKPDIVLCPCDRFEMVYPVARAFHQGFLVAQFHAGDVGSDHPDEMNRFAISFLSHIMFCETSYAMANLVNIGFEKKRIFVVGSTAFDHIKINESLCPKEPYDLVLLHPDPISAEQTKQDYEATLDAISHSSLVYWCVPNRDKNYEIIQDGLDKTVHEDDPERWKLYKPYLHVLGNLPREHFLGLLKNCRRFLGNSSSMRYEVPFFGVETVQIGNRNKNRESVHPIEGGSQRIAAILANIPIDDNLRRKTIKPCGVR